MLGSLAVASFMASLLVGCYPARLDVDSVDEAEFRRVVDHEELVLVKFGASWCAPCKLLDDELATIAADGPDQLRLLTLDVDESPNLSRSLGVGSIPHMMLFSKGRKLDQYVGLMDASAIRQWIALAKPDAGADNTAASDTASDVDDKDL